MTTLARSFLKYAGGKAKLVPDLMKHIPDSFKGYHELFCGGASLFWSLAQRDRLKHGATLADTNESLMITYETVRDSASKLIEALEEMPDEKDFFYELRAKDPLDNLGIARRFIYLNKTCFNGLHRVNRSGKFNVPYDGTRMGKRTICDQDNLRACSKILRDVQVQLSKSSFESNASHVKRGDLLYCDPPYMPLSKTSDFTSYTADGFGWKEQVLLRDVAFALKRRGVHVVLSNANHPGIREIYEEKGFALHEVMAARAVNSKGDRRGKIKELVIT